METKKWYESKTIWLAVAQGVAGIMTAYFSTNPGLTTVGIGAVVKSFLDMWLRMQSTISIQ